MVYVQAYAARTTRSSEKPMRSSKRAAATGHDDHIHARVGIELCNGLNHLGRALLALNMHMRPP